MARQAFNLGPLTSPPNQWRTDGNAGHLIDAAFFDTVGDHYLVQVVFHSAAFCIISIESTDTDTQTTALEFSQQFTDHGSITAESGGVSVTVTFPIGDLTERYTWAPGNGPEITAFAAAYVTGADFSITLDDGAGTVPSFTDPEGDVQSWRVGVAIAPITVPSAEGSPTPTNALTGALPNGITFDPATNVISGTPLSVGTGTGTITATNSEGTDTWTFTYSIAAAFAIPAFANPEGAARMWTVGVAITPIVVPQASGNPPPAYAALGALPTGIIFTAATRTLSGTPTVIGSGTTTVRASNSQGFDDWAFLYTTAAPLTVPAFPDAGGAVVMWIVGTAIEPITFPDATGNPTPVYTISDRPAGIVFNASLQRISGTPTAAGSGTITITATNSQGSSTWTVDYVAALPLTIPARPVAPTALAINNVGIRATGIAPFNGNDPITGYDWRIKKVADSAWTARANQTDLVQVFTDLDLATEYEIQFRASNSIGNSSYSPSGRVTTQATIVPTGITDTSASQGTGVVYRAVVNIEGSGTLYDVAGTSVIISGMSQFTVPGQTAIAIDQILNTVNDDTPGMLDQDFTVQRLTGDVMSYQISQWLIAQNILTTKTWWLVTDDAFVALPCAAPVMAGDPGYLSGGRHFWSTKQSQAFALALNALAVQDTVLLICADNASVIDMRAGTVPSRPQNLRAVASIATSSQITLFWEAPVSDGGPDISGYEIEVSEDAGITWTDLVADTGNTNLTYVHTGLSPVTRRYYRVSAINSNGTSAPSGVADAITNTALTGSMIEQTFAVDLSIISNALWLLRPGTASGNDWQFNQLLVASGNVLHYYAMIVYMNGQIGIRPSGAVDSVNNPNSYEFLEVVENDIVFTITSTDTNGVVTLEVTALPDLVNGEYLWTPTNQTDVVAFNAAVRAQTNPVLSVTLNFEAAAVPATIPGAPINLSVFPGDRSVVLSWGLPIDDGGGAIIDYEYMINDEAWIHTGSASRLFSIQALIDNTRLVNGTEYTFRVRAINAIGAGASTAAITATPRTIPDAPTEATAVPGNRSILFSWIAPAENNGAVITHYEYRLDGNTWIATADATVSINITSLVNGQGYALEVRAVNDAGGGASTAVINATPRTVPDAPTELIVVPGNRRVQLSWIAPVINGGADITGYAYQIDDGAWVATNSTTTNFAITGLTNGQAYSFRVRAINIAGNSVSSESVPGTPRTVAQAPTNLQKEERDRQVLISWTAPADSGGFPILSYEYEINGDGNWIDTASTSTIHLFPNLTNGIAYAFRIRAITIAAIPGNASVSINAIPRTVPTVPVELTGVIGNGQILLRWGTPISDGGARITSYEYQLDDGDWTTTGSLGLSFLVAMLTNGTVYTLAVRARNIAGPGPATAPITRLPFTTASAPEDFTVTPGNQRAVLAWTTPANGGTAITDYEYSVNNGRWIPITEVVTTITLTQFMNGEEYSFRVRAITLAGGGASSASISATPRTVPGAVRNFDAVPRNVSVLLEWDTSIDDGGADITDYEYRIDDGDWISFGDLDTEGTIAGLTNGQSYRFTVRAVNIAGGGVISTTIVVTPRTVPDAPTNLAAAAVSDSQITLMWEAPADDGGSPVTGYHIEIGESADSFTVLVEDTQTASVGFTVTGLQPETLRYFRVYAINIAGTGAFSNIANTRTTVRRTDDPDIETDVFERLPGYSFVYREDFIDILTGRTAALKMAAENAMNYEFSLMDNRSEFPLDTNLDFQSDRGIFIKAIFLGHVNFSSMSIQLFSDSGFVTQIGATIAINIIRDSRDGLFKHWFVLSEVLQLQAVQGIRIIPGDVEDNATKILVGSIVFARNIQRLPKQPRQGLEETVEPQTIRSGDRTLSYGSAAISQRPSFRVTVNEAPAYAAFVRRTAGRPFLVYDGNSDPRSDGHTAFFARRTAAASTTKRLHVEISFNLQGVV